MKKGLQHREITLEYSRYYFASSGEKLTSQLDHLATENYEFYSPDDKKGNKAV